MDSMTLWQFDMKEVRQTIAAALQLNENLVLDASIENNISRLTHFITAGLAYSTITGTETHYNGCDEIETITTSRETTISVNAYGQNAYAVLEKLSLALRFSAISSKLKKLGLSFMRTSQVRSLPTAIDGGLEQRAQIDIVLAHIHRINSPLNCGNGIEFNIVKD